MRLGQLARKLSLRPAQIVEFLATQNIQLLDSSNARMEDTHVTLVVQYFAPGSLEQIVEETEGVEEVAQTENNQTETEPLTPEPAIVEAQPTSEPEVIRVPKIELSGLKVLGKIELPEPKKKEQDESEDSTEPSPAIEEKPKFTKRNPKRDIRERNQQRPWKNPLEFQREREAREAEEKRRMAIERDKEKRKRHYEEKVKVKSAQPKKAKSKEQPEVIAKRIDARPVPKTWFGKFLRWWTT